MTSPEGRLLDVLHRVQVAFLLDNDRRRAFADLLEHLLEATGSNYGFIGEALRTPQGAPYVKTHAITNIAWDVESQRFYDENFQDGIEFHSLGTIFGAVLTTERLVIANDPANDVRRGGLPDGHPPLDAFLGIPLHAGREMVGMIGVANRPGGYDPALVTQYEPLLATCASLIARHRADERRRAAEAALRASEAQLQMVLASSLDAVVSMGTDGLIRGWNPRATEIFGWPAEDAIGGRLESFIIPERFRAGHREGLRRHVETGETRIAGRMLEMPAQRRSGEEFPVELIVYTTSSEGNVGYTAFIRDITERRRAKTELLSTMSWLGTLVENLQAGLLVEDEHRRVKRANQMLCTMFGMQATPDQLVGADCAAAAEGLSNAFVEPAEFLASIDKCLADREMVIAEKFRMRDGRMLERDYVPIIVDDLYLGHYWQYRDISDRQRASDVLAERRAALVQANADLARAARLKDYFLASMSHELRTPLNAILGLSEGLMAGAFGPLGDEVPAAIVDIEASGRHLLELINDVLDISKAEAGHISLNLVNLDLDRVCRSTVRLLREAARAKKLRVTTSFDPSLVTVCADAKRLKQVLVNLLSNAVKFTPKGGSVSLETVAVPDEELALITVRDNGIGIRDDDMERLFQPFVQLDNRLSRAHSGTGLGLALVHRLVELHGGSIKVQSEVGRGSAFTVRLPWQPDGDMAASSVEAKPGFRDIPQARAGDTPPRVLLADDNELNIRTTAQYLRSAGYVLDVARNGEEAVRLATEGLPELIIMDIQMPVMDGLEATRELRRSDVTRNIPIIAVTALAMPGDRERCIAAGADEYFSKPVSLWRLVATIERLRRTRPVPGA